MCPEVLAELAGLIAILDTLYDTPSPTIDGYTDFIFRNRYGDLLNPHSLNRAIERIIRDYNAEELKQNQDAGKISAFLTIENGSLIDGKMDKIREIYDLGVRLVTLTWNDDNCLGHCHSQKPEEMSRGLTGFGKEAVRYMQELGILVDVSHLSDGGFRDVAEASRRSGVPFVASHSNCRALAPATRNLTDAMIRELAECGGSPYGMNWIV